MSDLQNIVKIFKFFFKFFHFFLSIFRFFFSMSCFQCFKKKISSVFQADPDLTPHYDKSSNQNRAVKEYASSKIGTSLTVCTNLLPVVTTGASIGQWHSCKSVFRNPPHMPMYVAFLLFHVNTCSRECTLFIVGEPLAVYKNWNKWEWCRPQK